VTASRPPSSGAGHRLEPKEIARLVAIVAFAILLIAFIVNNSQSVRVNFVFANSDIPLIWVLIATAVLGAAIDRLISVIGRRRRTRSR
jgi:uncharacterized integral membrane protein